MSKRKNRLRERELKLNYRFPRIPFLSPVAPSVRELQIIALLARGLSTQEVADELHISEHTVSTHRKKMINKTGSKNTVELVANAIKAGWV